MWPMPESAGMSHAQSGLSAEAGLESECHRHKSMSEWEMEFEAGDPDRGQQLGLSGPVLTNIVG
jgi:hypothetical protein